MPDIFHTLPINGSVESIFDAVATPDGLIRWWANEAEGTPAKGSEYKLQFGPEYVWRAAVTKYSPATEFEIELTQSDDDWNGTRVGFVLEPGDGTTMLRFHHMGWPYANNHFRTSSFCWAMYLRCLKRFIEHDVVVPYADRFDG